jgi:hypothetical protein
MRERTRRRRASRAPSAHANAVVRRLGSNP